MFVIKWKEGRKTHEKTYDSKAGLMYRRRQIIKKFGESAIVSEVQAAGTGKDKVEIDVSGRDKNAPRGKIDPELSRVDAESDTTRLILSNWNPFTKTYTSRMYGTDFGEGFSVMEPDGSISLKGSMEEIRKKRDKETGAYTLPDGRTFAVSGWPIKEGKKK